MARWDVKKVVIETNKENNQLTVQFPSDILGIEASFSPLSLYIYCLDQSHHSLGAFQKADSCFFSKKAFINPQHNTSLGT